MEVPPPPPRVDISRNLSKQTFSTGSGRKTLKNSVRDNFHLLKSPDFRLLVLKCAGSYSRVFTVLFKLHNQIEGVYVYQNLIIFLVVANNKTN